MTSFDRSKLSSNLLPADLSRRILAIDGHDRCALPDWAASLIWLGAWCRASQVSGKRLIVFAILPTREFAAAFAGLGCLVAGARVFQSTLSWPTFKSLPIGREVFWTSSNAKARYRGKIIGFKEDGDDERILVEITKAAKRGHIGTRSEISKNFFANYRFTEDEPPTIPKAASMEAAVQSIGSLVEDIDPKWIWADGAEGLLITSVAHFENAIVGLSVSIDGQAPIAMYDILCSGRNKRQSHAKLRVDHHRGDLSGRFPLAILDGANGFYAHEHLARVSNMLVILDRSEYQEGIHNSVLELKSISCDAEFGFLQDDLPDNFPPGVEVAAYLVDGQ
jgi:hypothetical protein